MICCWNAILKVIYYKQTKKLYIQIHMRTTTAFTIDTTLLRMAWFYVSHAGCSHIHALIMCISLHFVGDKLQPRTAKWQSESTNRAHAAGCSLYVVMVACRVANVIWVGEARSRPGSGGQCGVDLSVHMPNIGWILHHCDAIIRIPILSPSW